MIVECLRLLTLHVAWKARGLSLEAEPNQDELRYRETLMEQRESLLEKVVEYAVGSRSKPCESVKRAVCLISFDLCEQRLTRTLRCDRRFTTSWTFISSSRDL